MNDANVQKQVADSLLERGIKINLPAPFFLRILGKKKITKVLHSPKLGTLIDIGR